MIDWDKPIETVDRRKARLVGTNTGELWTLVWVEAEPEVKGPGDVFLVNDEGHRCDSRSIEMGLDTSPFIRNAPVKREGWVVVEPKKNWTSNGSIVAILGSRYVYPTEQEALRAKEYHNTDLEAKVVPFEWEE